MNIAKRLSPIVALVGLASLGVGCSRAPMTPTQVVEKMDDLAGSVVRVRGKVESGAKCRLATEDGKWETYCKDCQVCEGPYVMRTGSDSLPLALSGSVDGEKLICEGKLNEVACSPLEEGQTYVIDGLLERGEPPKLIVEKVSLAD